MMRLEEDTPVVVEVGSTATVSNEKVIVVVRQDMRIIGQDNDEIGGGYSGGGRGWFHSHSVQRKGYRGGQAGHGSRGKPFPALELFIIVIESGTSFRKYKQA
ncbi:hypothetical protein GOBAR_AA07688 [Gossypium barbadense]|uniref:Uncharacterized protein n=1 Tax=Gossypium barbadense TaxID=3634 RepID=A0A2P5YBQ5_GOSBA|nr:hypothetical protein GOBAR_AA07688 [Gossypium barbadense]